jgi:hypothetical protein
MMATGAENMIQINGLRSEFPLYLFATYIGPDKKESKPSPLRKIFLENDFPFK